VQKKGVEMRRHGVREERGGDSKEEVEDGEKEMRKMTKIEETELRCMHL